MKIVGIDVGRGSAVLCCLDKLPANMQQHYKKLRREKEFYKVNCDAPGVDKLLSLKPDGIVIEPTGHWYSEFWLTVANQCGTLMSIGLVMLTAKGGHRRHRHAANQIAFVFKAVYR